MFSFQFPKERIVSCVFVACVSNKLKWPSGVQKNLVKNVLPKKSTNFSTNIQLNTNTHTFPLLTCWFQIGLECYLCSALYPNILSETYAAFLYSYNGIHHLWVVHCRHRSLSVDRTQPDRLLVKEITLIADLPTSNTA